MKKVPVEDSKPEILPRNYLFSKRFRFRKNDKRLPGSPDIVLPEYKTAIFVHGCFWHGHTKCKYAKLPTSNVNFWKTKIEANDKRDSKKVRLLKKESWNVITVWQCQLKTTKQSRTFIRSC